MRLHSAGVSRFEDISHDHYRDVHAGVVGGKQSLRARSAGEEGCDGKERYAHQLSNAREAGAISADEARRLWRFAVLQELTGRLQRGKKGDLRSGLARRINYFLRACFGRAESRWGADFVVS